MVLLTCKTKYIRQIQATKKAVWLKSLFNEIEKPVFTPVTPSIYFMQIVITNCNNQSVAMLAKNLVAHAKSKHIDIQ